MMAAGFDIAAHKAEDAKHYGIEGMRERVERMGGRLSIVSIPALGTTLSFSIRRAYLQFPAAEDSMQI